MSQPLVSILTHRFVDPSAQPFPKIYDGGGLGRYIYDLCGVIHAMGVEPQVHQLSQSAPFHMMVENIEVFGYPYETDQLADAFDTMAEQAKGALIYAGCICHPIQYKPGSLGICHGLNWDRISEKSKASQAVQTALDKLVRIVSVDSHFLTFCKAVCSYTDPEQVVLLPNAVDTCHFTPSERAYPSHGIRVLCPASINRESGIIPMMLVADFLLAAYPHVTIEFTGETGDDNTICSVFRIWMEEHPFQHRITHRAYSFEKIVEAYRYADIVVIPSIFSDGTLNSLFSCLEAISCGTAVVASNVGGLNDIIIDGFNGLLVPPTDEQISLAIKRLIETPELRKAMASNARQTATAFDKSIWKKRWRVLLNEYLGK